MLKILFFQFLLILSFNLSHAELIDINKSSIIFSSKESSDINNYSWQVNIESVLTAENNTYFFLKETMAENMSKTPFANTNRHLIRFIVSNDDTNIFRTASVSHFRKNLFPYSDEIKITRKIAKTKAHKVELEDVYKILESLVPTTLYCSIDYVYEKKKYNLIKSCDYLNFNTKKEDFFIQIAIGIVPFVSIKEGENINFGYAAINLRKENINLEFLLNKIGPIFTVYKNDGFIKTNSKNVLNILTYFKTKNSFSERVVIQDAKLSFFKYQ